MLNRAEGGGVCHASLGEQVVVAGFETFAFGLELGVQAHAEEKPEHVGVVVEGRTVVVTFDSPHVGVEEVFIQAVAVGITLCLKHQFGQFYGGEVALLALFEDIAFKEEAAGDVFHDLRGTLEAFFEEAEFFAAGGVLLGGLLDDGFAEDGRGFGEGHGHTALERGAVAEAEVVVGVTKFVGEGGDTAEGGFIVVQDAGLVLAETGAEGTVALAFSRGSVNPLFTVGAEGEVAHLFAVGAELLGDEGFGFCPRPFASGFADGGEEVVPGEGFGTAEDFSLGAEVAAEVREGLVRGGKHGVKGSTVNSVVEAGAVERRRPTPACAEDVSFVLDAVHGGGKRDFDGFPGGEFGCVGIASGFRVAVGGEGANGTHGEGDGFGAGSWGEGDG